MKKAVQILGRIFRGALFVLLLVLAVLAIVAVWLWTGKDESDHFFNIAFSIWESNE